MRRLWLVLLLFVGCSESDAPVAPGPVVRESRERPAVEAPVDALRQYRDRLPVEPVRTPAPAVDTDVLALRRYEQLINGRRAGTIEVRWTRIERDGRQLVKDVTRSRSRSARMMGRVKNVFSSETTSTTIRNDAGELISQDTVSVAPSRTDSVQIERTETGYRVRRKVGPNTESFEFETDRAAIVDAESFLGGKIAAGEAKPGATFKLPLLFAMRRAVVDATLTVVGPDDEGPGLKVVESFEGADTLWWFSEDGSVVRMRNRNVVIRRDDSVGLEDLPARPAAWRITLPANVRLPRIFTGKTMLVDVEIEADETTKAPHIPENPFTETIEREDGRLRARLKSHDDPTATTSLPIDPSGMEEHLKATPLMEVDDPELILRAKEIVGDEKDARAAATKIAEFVFGHLNKGSPDIPEPTCKQILSDRMGDCSEHALLFTGLCRAAGIPARRCSGWVCIGGDWGGHAWCEIWVGQWIGADPTTNEIGTRARYIFLRRPDDPSVRSGSITAERTRILIREVEYVDGRLEISDEGPTGEDRDAVLSGIRVAEMPEGWSIDYNGAGYAIVTNGEFKLWASISPDHGYRSLALLGGRVMGAKRTRLGGRDAVRHQRRGVTSWTIPLGRQNLRFNIRGDAPSAEILAAVFKPTLDRVD